MYEVTILNLKSGVSFVRQFTSPYLAQKFINKCKRSKYLHISSSRRWHTLFLSCGTLYPLVEIPYYTSHNARRSNDANIQHSLNSMSQLVLRIVDANHAMDGELTIVFLSLYLKH